MTDHISFQRSVLVPWQIFQKCRFEETESNTLSSTTKFLNESALPSDAKLKMLNQSEQLKSNTQNRYKLKHNNSECFRGIPSKNNTTRTTIDITGKDTNIPINAGTQTIPTLEKTSKETRSTGTQSDTKQTETKVEFDYIKKLGDIEVFMSAVKEKHRPFVKAIGERIIKSPHIIDWNDNYELILKNKTIENTNMVDLFKFLTRTSYMPQNDPPGAEMFYYTLLDILKVPKEWIKMTVPRRSERISNWISL